MHGLIPAHAGKTAPRSPRSRPAPAHPRSRGENVETKDRGRLGDGSSPLTRGKHFLRGNRNGGERLIPAHAGKTRRPTPYRTAPEAHPRSRGENVEPLDRVAVHEGSSPLTRGKRGPLPRPLGRVRLIPAHAGKTPASVATSTDRRAHPRSRGENVSWTRPASPTRGSSPLTRGKPVHEVPEDFASGLIPAHAGKTADRAGNETVDRAHPRSRGENRARQVAADGGHGSSPLTRGKHVIRESVNVWHGLIPAHAGKTRTAGDGGRAPGAHPRSRGENAATARVGPLERGSSPLTRGKHREADERRDTARLIPAHAGKTPGGRRGPPGTAAHPRSRGENPGGVPV